MRMMNMAKHIHKLHKIIRTAELGTCHKHCTHAPKWSLAFIDCCGELSTYNTTLIIMKVNVIHDSHGDLMSTYVV